MVTDASHSCNASPSQPWLWDMYILPISFNHFWRVWVFNTGTGTVNSDNSCKEGNAQILVHTQCMIHSLHKEASLCRDLVEAINNCTHFVVLCSHPPSHIMPIPFLGTGCFAPIDNLSFIHNRIALGWLWTCSWKKNMAKTGFWRIRFSWDYIRPWCGSLASGSGMGGANCRAMLLRLLLC